MLKNLGKVIWRQSREISVSNYPNHLVYEIYTNSGYLYCIQAKEGEKIECVKNIDDIIRNEALSNLWRRNGAQPTIQNQKLLFNSEAKDSMVSTVSTNVRRDEKSRNEC